MKRYGHIIMDLLISASLIGCQAAPKAKAEHTEQRRDGAPRFESYSEAKEIVRDTAVIFLAASLVVVGVYAVLRAGPIPNELRADDAKLSDEQSRINEWMDRESVK